jgi:protein SCO1/2
MRRKLGRWAAAAALVAGLAPPAGAQLADQIPPELEEVGVEEHLGARLPLELEFRDSTGSVVRLGDYFDGVKPVVLTLNYYKCPMLCGLQLNGLLDGLRELEWTPGQEFELVTVSINPLETPALAADKKQNYIQRYERPSAAAGWHFLTGQETEIRRLAETVGFGYTYDRSSGEYAHAAVIFIATPDGRLARYLYGIEYPASRLRLALLEASAGEIGSTIDQLILYCFHYDPESRRYAPVAMNIMRVGGGATALVVGLTLGGWWLREARRRKNSDRGTATT